MTSLHARIPLHELRDQYLILEDGTVAIGYQVQGCEEEALSEEAYYCLVKDLASALRHLPPGMLLQKLDIYYPVPFAYQPPAHALFAAQDKAHYAGRSPLKHQCWLYLCYNPHQAAYAPHTTFLAKGYTGLHHPLKKLALALETLQKAAQLVEPLFPQAWHATRLTDQQNLQRLYAYFNLAFDQPPLAFENTLERHLGWLQVGTHHVGAVSLQSQAAQPHYFAPNRWGVTAPFTAPLSQALHYPHITVQAIGLQDTEAMLRQRHEAMEWRVGAQLKQRDQRNATTALGQLAAFETALQQRGEVVATLALVVLLYTQSHPTLVEAIAKATQAFKQRGMVPLVETYDVANLFFAAMPAGAGQLYRALPMALETAVAYLNPSTPRQGAQQGVLLADRHGAPLYYDPFNTALDNQHAFVFGPSGAGKSFFNGKLIKARYEAGHVVIVMDSGGTYERLFAALGGRYIAYHPEKPLRLNPFLVQPKGGQYRPSVSKLQVLVQLLGKMWKGDLKAHPLQEVEKALLMQWLKQYYAALDKGDVPSLRGFYDWLQAYVQQAGPGVEAVQAEGLFPLQAFFIVLEPFAHGVYADHFNAAEVDYLTDQRLVCFELGAVKRHPKLYPLVVQILFDFAFAMVEQYPTEQKFIDIEEGWSMLDDYAEEPIEAFFRKGRKTKTSIRIITQDVEEIKRSRIAGAMRNNASTCVLLYNEKERARQEVGEFLGLSALDMEKYGSLQRQAGAYREVLIKEMDRSAVWRVEASLAEHALLTSEPEERDRITALIEEQGDVSSGIRAWVKEQEAR